MGTHPPPPTPPTESPTRVTLDINTALLARVDRAAAALGLPRDVYLRWAVERTLSEAEAGPTEPRILTVGERQYLDAAPCGATDDWTAWHVADAERQRERRQQAVRQQFLQRQQLRRQQHRRRLQQHQQRQSHLPIAAPARGAANR